MCGKPDSEFWNQNDEKFAGTTEATKDNEEVAWPALMREVDQNFPKPADLPIILDFGCGGGQLANIIGSRGLYKVVGIDPAPNMIAQAKRQTEQGVTFVDGTIYDLKTMEPFDGIVSSMVLQFVDTAGEYFRLLSLALRPGGLLSFVVFNPPFVSDQLAAKTELFFYDECGCLRMRLDGRSTPMYDRSSEEYVEMLSNEGFDQITARPMPYSEDQGVYSDRFLIISCRRG